jgi:hypothetical protein
MENKQTAVQFLIEHIKIDAMYEAKTLDEWVSVFDRAKQMEKEQIMDAVDFGTETFGDVAEQYYNGTYGTQLPEE